MASFFEELRQWEGATDSPSSLGKNSGAGGLEVGIDNDCHWRSIAGAEHQRVSKARSSMTVYADVVRLLRERRRAIADELGEIDRAVRVLGKIRTPGLRAGEQKARLSAAARGRIAAAQRARWKKFREAQGK